MKVIQESDRNRNYLYRLSRLSLLLLMAILTACSVGGPELVDTSVGEEPTLMPSATITAAPTLTPTPAPQVITAINAPKLTQITVLQPESDYVWNMTSLALSTDGNALAAGASNGRIYLWNWRNRTLESTLTGSEYVEPLMGVAFSPDDSQLVSGSYFNGIVQLWDRTTGEVFGELIGHSDKLWSVDYSPTGKTVASSSLDTTVKIWNVETWLREVVLNSVSPGLLSKVEYSPDGQTLAIGDYSGTIYLWDLVENRKIDTLYGHKDQICDLEYSTDGLKLASSSFDMQARLWDIEASTSLAVFDNEGEFALSVALSPDGEVLATGGEDARIRVWSTSTGELMAKLEGHEQSITGLLYTLDGTTLVSSSYDGTVRLWGVMPKE